MTSMVDVEALLATLTLEEKVGQMTQPERMAVTPEEVSQYHLGSVLSGAGSWPGGNTPSDWVSMNDAYWMHSMAPSRERPAIPLIYGVDAVHGNANVLGATVFPHNIGLGAAGDADLVRRISQVTAKEILATGVDWTFAPTLAVVQDYRWGRTYESFGADPTLVGKLAVAAVEGLQGDLGEGTVMACAKHWVGDGGTSYGVDQGDTAIDRAELDRLHIAPYRPVIEAGVLSVMASFNSWNGDKLHGHQHLLEQTLKGELGFEGFVISDWDGIDYLNDDCATAAAMAVNAGIDMVMVSENWREFWHALAAQVRAGVVPMARIDDAVRRILKSKRAMGLFDRARPAERAGSNDTAFGSPAHREVAREAVRKSMVLLKNENAMLPLDPGAEVIVLGKCAHNLGFQCGGFTVDWQGTDGNDRVLGGTTIWEGIQRLCPGATLSVGLAGEDADPARHKAAIVVIGERPYAEGLGDIRRGDDVIVETGSRVRGSMKVLQPYGFSLELQKLHPEDIALLRGLSEKGIPVVTVLISGRPLVTEAEMALSQAFVAAWLPGSEGHGVAEVLFGRENFSGRLPFAWPERERISKETVTQAFPRGFGLRYD